MAVQMFRSVLAMSVLRRHEFTRPIESFITATARSESTVLIVTDACLTGLGVLVYGWRPGDRWVPLGGAAHVSIAAFGWAGISDFQNTAEFVGLLCGVAVAVRLGLPLTDAVFSGDSKTALEWALAL